MSTPRVQFPFTSSYPPISLVSSPTFVSRIPQRLFIPSFECPLVCLNLFCSVPCWTFLFRNFSSPLLFVFYLVRQQRSPRVPRFFRPATKLFFLLLCNASLPVRADNDRSVIASAFDGLKIRFESCASSICYILSQYGPPPPPFL